MPVAAGKSYLSALKEIGRRRWDRALRRCRECSTAIEDLESQEPLAAVLRDCEEVRDRLRARMTVREAGDAVMKEALGLIRTHPEEAADLLETFLLLHQEHSREEWWREAAENLARACARSDRAPEERDDERPRRPPERESDDAPPPRGESDDPPEGSKKSRAWWDRLEAESCHNRGLKFYLKGDLRRAEEEWSKALRLDPEAEKTRKVLLRVRKELGASRDD